MGAFLTVLALTTFAVDFFSFFTSAFLGASLTTVGSTVAVVTIFTSSTKLTVARAALSPFLQPDFSIRKLQFSP